MNSAFRDEPTELSQHSNPNVPVYFLVVNDHKFSQKEALTGCFKKGANILQRRA